MCVSLISIVARREQSLSVWTVASMGHPHTLHALSAIYSGYFDICMPCLQWSFFSSIVLPCAHKPSLPDLNFNAPSHRAVKTFSAPNLLSSKAVTWVVLQSTSLATNLNETVRNGQWKLEYCNEQHCRIQCRANCCLYHQRCVCEFVSKTTNWRNNA
jgi:hypothetical protein